MKICLAQIRPVKGDIDINISNHKKFINLAVLHKADVIIFPELSITGYEPTLAKALACEIDESRFDCFQEISDTNNITIGIGAPVKKDDGIRIGMIIFRPHTARLLHLKKYLHADEEPFFISGQNLDCPISNEANIALAICYELSVPEHSENAFKNGAEIYIASVAKTVDGVDKATRTLSFIASKYSMTVLMANCVGICDGAECGGKTSVLDNKGLLLAQLGDLNEGIIIIDTATGNIITEEYKQATK
jgi:predicted amidohydrolase